VNEYPVVNMNDPLGDLPEDLLNFYIMLEV